MKKCESWLRDVAESSSPIDFGVGQKPSLLMIYFNNLLEVLMIGYIITVWGNRMMLVDYHEDDGFDSIQMRRLQLVDTEASLLERSIMTMTSLNLIWICLNKHPNSSLPSWILMKNLRLL